MSRRIIVLGLALLFGLCAHKSAEAPDAPEPNQQIPIEQLEPLENKPIVDRNRNVANNHKIKQHPAKNLIKIRHICEIVAICLWACISGAVALRISNHTSTNFFRGCTSIAFLFVLVTLFAFVIKSRILMESAILVVLLLHCVVLVKEFFATMSTGTDDHN